MNSSFAIWYYPHNLEDGIKPNIDLHINLWINDHHHRNIIDFGFMINNPTKINKFNIFIPFKVEDKNIELLTNLLVDKPKIANLVFNRDVEIISTNGQTHHVKIKGVDKEFYTINYNLVNTINGTNLEHGSVLEFNFNSNINDKPKYVRFRIKDLEENDIVTYMQRAISFLSGLSNTLVSFEVNINEYRKLPSDINQNAKDTFIDINRVDMFVMTDIEMEHIFSSINDIETRILETKDWIDYNNQLKDNQNKNILAYQYTKKGNDYFKDFTIFNKFNHEKVRYSYIALLVIFFTGFVGSLLSTIDIAAISLVSVIFGGLIMFLVHPYLPFINNGKFK